MVERETFDKVKEEDVMTRFQPFKTKEEKSIKCVLNFIYYSLFIFVSFTLYESTAKKKKFKRYP
ncbi:hypothetical protein HanRHA438_Chr01g0038761 [Helianthus annuus]|nr:hypothetical protein HanRHA438_Chr01g0038761 [Helianthus annuus]